MIQNALEQGVSYIDSWLRFKTGRIAVPGFAVAVMQNGKPLFNQAYGYGNLERKEKLTPRHLFRIASHSKTYTAAAILLLQEQGKLQLDDLIVSFVPWLKQHPDPRLQKLTIHQVLTHGAGMVRDGLNADYRQVLKPFPNGQEYKAAMLETTLVHDGDAHMKYSTFAYGLLGLVIEAVTGQIFNEYVKGAIIQPLRLKHTGPDYGTSIQDQVATSYSRKDGEKRLPIAKDIATGALSPAIGFYATPAEACTFYSALMPGSGKLLSDQSKRDMIFPHRQVENSPSGSAYGLGCEIEYIGKRLTFGHSGAIPGFVSKTYCDPASGIVVTALVNAVDGNARAIARGVYKTLRYFEKYTGSPPQPTSHFAGRFMGLWDVLDIVPVGERIVAVDPDSWSPFDKPQELTYVDSKTLQISKAISYQPEGELIRFMRDKKQTTSINYAGMTLLSERDYLRRLTLPWLT